MKLINLEEDEEERDRDGVKILMQKYSKLFKYYFNKYALSRAQHSKVDKWEYYGDKQINVTEMCKLLRDHDLLASLANNSVMNQVVATYENSSAYQKLNKDQVGALVRLVNIKNG
jgi:hypothetical protein